MNALKSLSDIYYRYRNKIILILTIILLVIPVSGIRIDNTKYGEYGQKSVFLPKIPYGYSFKSGKFKWYNLGGYDNLYDDKLSIIYNSFFSKIRKKQLSEQTVEFGLRGEGSNQEVDDALKTITADGNLVLVCSASKFAVQPEGLQKALDMFGLDVLNNNTLLEDLVKYTSTSDYFSSFSELYSLDLPVNDLKFKKADEAIAKTNQFIRQFGLEISTNQIGKHIFKHEYQALIDGEIAARAEVKTTIEDIENQRSFWEKEFKTATQSAEKAVRGARGYKQQKVYEASATNVQWQQRILTLQAKGAAEVMDIQQRVKALSGEFGDVLTDIEVYKIIKESDARFVVLPGGNGQSDLNVNRTDNNDLLDRFGLLGKLSISGENPVDNVPVKPVNVKPIGDISYQDAWIQKN